jgi:hypothetical protein
MGDSAGENIENAKRMYGDGVVPEDADLNAPHAEKGDPGEDPTDDAVDGEAEASEEESNLDRTLRHD